MHHILEQANQLVLVWHHIPPTFWQALLAAGVLTPLLNVYKHFRFTRREQQVTAEAMHIAVIVGAGLFSVAQYLLSNYPQNPTVIAMHTAVLGFMTQPVYFIAIKPLWSFFEAKFSEASVLEKELRASSAVPAGGVPLSAKPPVAAPVDPKAAFEQSIDVRSDFSQ